jgi:protocatechuate 3,4-dioxygenase beta subunit
MRRRSLWTDLSAPALARPLDRRAFTRGALAALGLGAVAVACGGKGDSAADSGAGEGDDGSDGSDGGGDIDGGDGLSDADVAWATGGTAAMAGGYPDPFTDAPEACALTCEVTLGPCYIETIEREDISEGSTGLPMRLCFRVVDSDCNPVVGAAVDVWHTNLAGLYSGEEAAEMCTGGDAAAVAGRWFRGVQNTDSEGKVFFNSCFPGWYSSRAVHIHLLVRVGGEAFVITQVFFASELLEDIFSNQPEYAAFGQPNVSNDEDSLIADADPDMLQMNTARQADGALLAYKTLVVRTSLSESSCAV